MKPVVLKPRTPKALTCGVVARICCVAPRTAARWIDSGELKGYRIPMSKDRRVEVADLREFLEAHGLPTERLEEYLKQQEATS